MINTIIVFIITGCFCLGIIDRAFFKGKFGLAKEVESGVGQVAGLILSLAGIMCLAPLLAKVLTPVFTPVYGLVGGDPASFAGIILGPDGGAFPIASSMTDNEQVIALSGLFLASILGVTVCFSLPFALGVVQEKDKKFISKGMLAGIISSPIGAFIGGLVSGFDILFMLKNLSVAIVIVIILVVLLIFFENGVVKGFLIFSKIIQILSMLSLMFATIELMTGYKLIPWLDSMGDKLGVIGNMGLSIAGALCMVKIIQWILKKPLEALGKKVGLNGTAMVGILMSTANAMPVYGMVKDMNNKGKIMCIAFSVPACYALGSHLAYTSTMMPQYIAAEVVTKLAGGVVAMLIAWILFCRKGKLEPDEVNISEAAEAAAEC